MTLTSDDILSHLAFDNSSQANIISEASSGKIIMVNKAACKLLGYSKKELLIKSGAAIFDIKESGFKKMLKQRAIEGQSETLVTAIKKSGKRLPCKITSAVFKDEHGIEKSITTIADMSKDILKQKEIDIKKEKIVADDIIVAQTKSLDMLAEDDKWIRYIAKASYDIMWDWDIVTGEIYVGDSIEEVFGYKVQNNTVNFKDICQYLLPEEKDTVKKKIFKALASGNKSWSDLFMFRRRDGSMAFTNSRASIIRDGRGKALRLIGATQDVSMLQELKEQLDSEITAGAKLEERLEQEIKLKEKQVEQAIEEAKETERSDLGKELHDNVNQLLGASRIYLEMAKHGGTDSELYLSRSSEYTMTAIDEIRKLTKMLTTDTIKNIGLCDSIAKIANDTMEINPVRISYALNCLIENRVNDKFKLNLYRMVQEKLNNILKYAKATKVTINLSQNKKSIILFISDNGVGFDTSKKRTGTGLANIKSRAAFYKGTADLVSQPGQGCALTIKFPVTDMLLNKS